MLDVRNRGVAGFTLMELIVVIAVIALLSASTVLSLAFYIPNLQLKTVVQDISIQVQKARLEGIRRSRPVAVRFFVSDLSGVNKFGPVIWVDDNFDESNAAHPLLEAGEDVLYRFPVDEIAANVFESSDNNSVRFDSSLHTDGVSFPGNNFVINSRGISNKAGSVHLINTRGTTKEVMVTLGGAIRVF